MRNKFSKVVGYKTKFRKSLALLEFNRELSAKEITIRKTKVKDLRINLNKEMKDSYTENFKILIDEDKDMTHW